MQMKGIDVSSFQGDIDFEQVKNSGMDFVIIKAGEWNHTVDKFEENYAAAKAAGLHIGFYWFCDGFTLDEISMEADACIDALKGKQFDFPIYMDFELDEQFDLGKKFCSDAVRLFCEKLEKEGYYVGLYTSATKLNDYIDDDIKDKYTMWVADWRGYCGYDGKYGMWQYGQGYVPGINGMTDFNIVEFGTDVDYPGVNLPYGVDLDYSYEDFPSLIVPNGFNNYPEPSDNWENDECKDIANQLSVKSIEPELSGDRWFLIDRTCAFTLETLPYAKIKVYIVGGGCDGAEWRSDETGAYASDIGGQGGSVLVKELTVVGSASCYVTVADVNNPIGTAVKIGNDVYKCTDEGSVWRKPASSANADINGGVNAGNGTNGVETPYGYIGSSGGGGGTYGGFIKYYAGKGGIGAGDGGEADEDGADAQNYGCGGGAAGVGGKAGRGRGGCVIFEILDSGECDNSPNNPDKGNSGCGCGNSCDRLSSLFTCPEPAESSSSCEKNTTYRLSYDGEEPIEVETETSTPCADDVPMSDVSVNNAAASTQGGSCGCGKLGSTDSGDSCGCGSSGGKSGCVSYDVKRWGENWLLFDETGEYTLNFDADVKITAYIVGGGCDGKSGLYYNKTAYGGDGGMGGYVNIVSDIEVKAGVCEVSVIVGNRGCYGGTSVVVGNYEYCCNGSGNTAAERGNQGVCGKSQFQNAGNGANGVETPFGYVGSSGGGGAAYYNGNATNRGYGGLSAGNGGKIVEGKSTKGDNAAGYGCGGGGGAASSTSWCKGGKGKRGCVIITW